MKYDEDSNQHLRKVKKNETKKSYSASSDIAQLCLATGFTLSFCV
jgi:hypothetical protein